MDGSSAVWVAEGAGTRVGGAQGAAWDPANRFIATLSCDRTCRCDPAAPVPHRHLIGCTDELWVTVAH